MELADPWTLLINLSLILSRSIQTYHAGRMQNGCVPTLSNHSFKS